MIKKAKLSASYCEISESLALFSIRILNESSDFG